MVESNCTCKETRWVDKDVLDYRKLNALPIPDPYCMPLVDDLLDQVGQSTYLSSLTLPKVFIKYQ